MIVVKRNVRRNDYSAYVNYKKVCRTCQQELDATAFRIRTDGCSVDGLGATCKKCCAAKDFARLDANRDAIYARNRERVKRRKGMDFGIDYSTYQKLCKGCEKTLAASEFSRSFGTKDGLHPICKKCSNIRSSNYWEEHKEELKPKNREYGQKNRDAICANKKQYYQNNKPHARDWQLKRHYGISLEQYNKMLEDQGGGCAICGGGSGIEGRVHAVDHDHKTGKVRALLCIPCNKAIGLFEEAVPTLKKAIDYLTYWKAAQIDAVGRTREQALLIMNKAWFNINTKKIKRRELKVTTKMFKKLVAAQNNKCPLCQNELEGRTPALDHDHNTGMIRGVLCHWCNFGLGGFKDSPETIQKAVDYLSKHKQDSSPKHSINNSSQVVLCQSPIGIV